MRRNLNRTAAAALLAGGMMVATAGFAQAVPLPLDIDEEIRVGDLVSVPVKVCGNAINILGASNATCDDNAPKVTTQRTVADEALVSAPITVCGNSVGVVGSGDGSCGTTEPERPEGTIEVPVTVCGTSATALGNASGECETTELPEEPQPEQPQPEQPRPDQPGAENPGDDGDDNSGSGTTGDDSGDGFPQTGVKASQQVSSIPSLSRTGADPLEFLLVGMGLMTAGVMARRGARRVKA